MTDAQLQANSNPYNTNPPDSNQWNASSPANLAPNPMNNNLAPAYYNQNNQLAPNPMNNNPPSAYYPNPPPAYYPPNNQLSPNPMNNNNNVNNITVITGGGGTTQGGHLPVCPSCRQSAGKMANYETSQAQILWCLLIFLFLPPFCCIPCCMNSCHDIRYSCLNCHATVGYYHRPCC